MNVTPLVLAKAPIAGQVKTRLGADVGAEVAAELAAAALLDTLDVCREAFPEATGVLALAGDLGGSRRADELSTAVAGWNVVAQEGDSFAERIVNAHARVSGPVVQIGMDTPHLEPAKLSAVADRLDSHEAVLGLAEDGGWWVLGLRDPREAARLRAVRTSSEDTGEKTRLALAGLDVAIAATCFDIDTVAEAGRAAQHAPNTRFARAWRDHERLERKAQA